ncbi:hypothetical protein ZIOFF_020559 [Zingiber officinale]|uniref:DUF1639 family protein n=2 Tax=Zingiber officinale TaxID=94328 RepID=A0A8J5H007_ZINOF|nr:hypothetical protein ZIOFF_020559 [Zingiber officinale]
MRLAYRDVVQQPAIDFQEICILGAHSYQGSLWLRGWRHRGSARNPRPASALLRSALPPPVGRRLAITPTHSDLAVKSSPSPSPPVLESAAGRSPSFAFGMVISRETPSRRPNPSPETAVAAESRLPLRGTQGSLLQGCPFQILKTWGRHRGVRCMGKEETADAGERRSPSESACPRIRVPDSGRSDGDDSGVEEVRERLLVHLREAADRMKLVLPKGSGETEPAPVPELTPDLEASDGSKALPWNLRTRRGASREIERRRSVSPPPPPLTAEKRTVRLRSEGPRRKERPRFSISLTKEEIDEDIYAVTGCRARRRPRKRPRVIQKQLEALFPGSWLTEIAADSYKVPE